MTGSTTDLLDVLGQFDVASPRLTEIEAGRVNSHWLVSTPIGPLVLRRYRHDRTPAAIQYEHDLLSFAAGRGWPVAVPMPAASGETALVAGGHHFALFPFLEGEPVAYESLAHKRIKGRLLARFHADMAAFPRPEQRDGFGRAWELDLFVQPAGLQSFNALLARFADQYPDLASHVRRERYRNLRELARLGYGETPTAVVHCDFHHDNLLFKDGQLTGLLDFDVARRDAPAYDIAVALTLECLEAPDYDAIDLEMARAFLEGYAEHRPLSFEEARLLPPLVRAAIIWLVMFRLVEWHETSSQRAVQSITRSVERRFPALVERWAALDHLAHAVAE